MTILYDENGEPRWYDSESVKDIVFEATQLDHYHKEFEAKKTRESAWDLKIRIEQWRKEVPKQIRDFGYGQLNDFSTGVLNRQCNRVIKSRKGATR